MLTGLIDLFFLINYIVLYIINKFFSIQMEELDKSNKMITVPNNWMNTTKKPTDGRYYFLAAFFVSKP